MKYITERIIEYVQDGSFYRRIEIPPYLARDCLGGRIYDKLYLSSGGSIPKYLGKTYEDFAYRAIAFHPIPLNYIVRLLRKFFWYGMKLFYWVGLVDVCKGERFTWNDFFRIKVR